MAEIGDLVRYRVHKRHETVTGKLGPGGPRDRKMVEGSVYHFAHRTFAGVIAAVAEAVPPADGKGKPIPQFVIGLFVPDKPIAYVHATEGKEPGQFEVRG